MKKTGYCCWVETEKGDKGCMPSSLDLIVLCHLSKRKQFLYEMPALNWSIELNSANFWLERLMRQQKFTLIILTDWHTRCHYHSTVSEVFICGLYGFMVKFYSCFHVYSVVLWTEIWMGFNIQLIFWGGKL